MLLPLVCQRPIYVALGNHDYRDHFLDVFESPAGRRQAVKGKYIVTVDAGPVRFILLDSLVPRTRRWDCSAKRSAPGCNATCRPATTSR
jgi:hypothetical protein